MGKHHDYDNAIVNDSKENGLEEDDDFDGFHDNKYVTGEDEETYMNVLNKLTDSGEYVDQFLIEEEWDQDLHEDNEDYTNTFMELINYSPWATHLGLCFRGSHRSTSSYRLGYLLW